MINFENKVPSYYIEESRDFQLFSRLYNLILGGIKFDVDSILNLYDPNKCNNRVLELLCIKLGFFPKRTYNNDELRGIIKIFPLMMKYKGSLKAFKIALKLSLNLNKLYNPMEILVDNESGIINVFIFTVNELDIDFKLFYDLMDYIKPAGYLIEVSIAKTYEGLEEYNLINNLKIRSDATQSLGLINKNNEGVDSDYYFIDRIEIVNPGEGEIKQGKVISEEGDFKGQYQIDEYTNLDGYDVDGEEVIAHKILKDDTHKILKDDIKED